MAFDGANGLVYVKTDDTSAWTQLAAAGGNSLQQAYDVAPDVVTDGSGGTEWSKADGSANAEYVFRVEDLDDAAGTNTMEIDKSPAVNATAGFGLAVTAGANNTSGGISVVDAGSGNGLLINKTGTSGSALVVQDNGQANLTIGNAGNMVVTPTDKQAFDVDTTGTGGTISLDSTIDNINSTTTAGALETGGDNTVSTDTGSNSATGGDVFVGAINTSAGTSGGLELRAGETFGAIADGAITMVTEAPTTVTAGDITIKSENQGVAGSTGDILIGMVRPNGATNGGIGISATQALLTPAAGEVLIESTAELDITSGDLLDINAAGGMDVDVTGAYDMLATTTFSIDGTGASNVSATSGNLTLSTITSGDVLIDAADVAAGSGGAITATAGTGNGANSGGDISLTAGTGGATDGPGGAVSVTGGAGGATNSSGGAVTIAGGAGAGTGVQGTITFDALGSAAPIPFNETGEEDLDSFFSGNATSVIGAINYLATGASSSDVTVAATANGTTALVANNLVSIDNDGGNSRAFKADANGAGEIVNPVGFAQAAAAVDTAVDIVVAGEITIQDALWDVAPVAADAGKRVYMSTTAGNVTLTAPSTAGDVVMRVAIVSFADGNADTTRVIVQMGEPTTL
jgi:hypothetical protein